MSETWCRLGHTTRSDVKTGCSVLLFDQLVPAAVDVRGGAPGTRETHVLNPGNIGMLDAIVFSGGSAFGLDAASGVMQYLREQGRGYPTRTMPVPLVASAIIYDLAVGSAVAPAPEDGYLAAQRAVRGPWEPGQIGAGTGATVAKVTGTGLPGGLGIAQIDIDGTTVMAIVVVNAVGSIVDPNDGTVLSGDDQSSPLDVALGSMPPTTENTTIGCVLIDRAVSRRALVRSAASAHAGLTRTIVPAHTPADGDTFFAACPAEGSQTDAEMFRLCVASQAAVESAILSIFRG